MNASAPSLSIAVALALAWSSVASAAPNPPQLVADLSPGTGGSFPSWSVISQDDAFFSAYTGNGNDVQLFRSDGTAAHTTKLTSIVQSQSADGVRRLFVAGSRVCFDAKGGLYASDGTTTGTTIIAPQLRDIVALGRYPFLDPRVTRGGRTYLIGAHPTMPGLWSTDGTAAGTKFVAPASGTLLGAAGASGGRVLFTNAGTMRSTDGTTTTDVITVGSYVSRVGELGSVLFFTRYLGANAFELWKTDGTAAGTTKVKTLPYVTGQSAPPYPSPADNGDGPVSQVHDGKLYFVFDDLGGKRVWVTDGTDAGTNAIGPTFTASLVEANGTLFLDLPDAAQGHELHAIATGATTPTVVADLVAGPGGSFPSDFILWQGKATFVARTPVQQLYTTNGVTITPFGPPISNGKSVGAGVQAASPKALFLTGFDDAHGSELWAAVDPTAVPADAGPDASREGGPADAGGIGDGSGDDPDTAASLPASPGSGDGSASCACTAAGGGGASGAGAAAVIAAAGLAVLGALRSRRPRSGTRA